MKSRLFFTMLVVFSLSFGIYYISQWLAADGANIPSRQVIPAIAALLCTGLIWAIWNLEFHLAKRNLNISSNTNKVESHIIEKRKRDRLDAVLRDLSDDDLLRLRHRLLDGTINKESVEDYLIDENAELRIED